MKPRVGASHTDVAEDLSAPAGIAIEIHHRALRTPHAQAVVDGEVGLDYATLNVAAATVAQELGRRGVTAGQAVAVAMPRSWRLVGVMLGILRLGAQVVPLDTQSPAERRHFILRDSAAVALVHETIESVTDLPQDMPALAADALLPEIPERPDTAAAVEAPSAPARCPSSSTPPERRGSPRESRSVTQESDDWHSPATSASSPVCAMPAWPIRRSTR